MPEAKDEHAGPQPERRASRPRRRGTTDDVRREDKDKDRKRRGDREPEREGDDPMAHARFLERRWYGSAPPTAELHARALRQWRALPGAIVLRRTN
jgi:hypothetical protein